MGCNPAWPTTLFVSEQVQFLLAQAHSNACSLVQWCFEESMSNIRPKAIGHVAWSARRVGMLQQVLTELSF